LSTAPVIFAAEKHPNLKMMMERKFSKPGDVEIAFQVRIFFETLNYYS
jgi:decaprenyl-diphosphate synthase subunit 1